MLLGLGAAVAYPSALSLTGVLGWRWVFWLTVPATLALLTAAHRLVPGGDGARERRPLDLLGALLATVSVTALVAGVVGPGRVLLPVAAVATALLVAHERRTADPLLPGAVVRSRRLLGGSGGIAANSALWSVVVFVLAQQLQDEGWSPQRAGAAVVPASLGIVMAGAVLVPRLRRRIGSVRTARLGLLTSAASVAPLALGPPTAVLLGLLFVLGVGLSAAHTGLTEHVLKAGEPGSAATSAAVSEASTHVGGAVAVAVFATVLATGSFAPAYLVAAAAGLAGVASVSALTGRPEERLDDRAGGLAA